MFQKLYLTRLLDKPPLNIGIKSPLSWNSSSYTKIMAGLRAVCFDSFRKFAVKHKGTQLPGNVVFARTLFGIFGKEKHYDDEKKPTEAIWGDKTIYESQFDKNVFWRPWKGLSFNVIRFIQQPIKLEPKYIRQWLERKIHEIRIRQQEFILARKVRLGTDISAAYIMLYIGGSVRFCDQTFWMKKKDEEYQLPKTFIPKLYMEAVNLDKTEIVFEGLENIDGCTHIKSLSFRECDFLDDWCVDKITAAKYRNKLEHLDLSKCKNITERGLAALHRFRSLKTLVIEDMPNVKHKELVALCLEEVLPSLQIVGVDFDLVANETDLPPLDEKEDYLHLNQASSTKQKLLNPNDKSDSVLKEAMHS